MTRPLLIAPSILSAMGIAYVDKLSSPSTSQLREH